MPYKVTIFTPSLQDAICLRHLSGEKTRERAELVYCYVFSERLRFRLFCLFERDLNKYEIQISSYWGIYGLEYTHGK